MTAADVCQEVSARAELPEQTGSSETNFPEHSWKATGATKRTSRKQKLSSRKKLLLRNTKKNAKIAIFPELPKIFPEAKTIFPEAANYLPRSKTTIFLYAPGARHPAWQTWKRV